MSMISNTVRYAAALCLAALTGAVQAQKIRFSLGADVLYPSGGLTAAVGGGAGPTAGAEYPLGTSFSTSFDASYIILPVVEKAHDRIASAALIPLHLGMRYWLDDDRNGFYMNLSLGVDVYNERRQSYQITDPGTPVGSRTFSSFGVGLGWRSHALDFALHNMFLFTDEDTEAQQLEPSSYLNLRIALILFKKNQEKQ